MLLLLFSLISSRRISAYYSSESQSFTYKEDTYDTSAASRGIFYDNRTANGWSELQIESPQISSSYGSEIEARAAGYVEGVLTHDLFRSHQKNVISNICKFVICENGAIPTRIVTFFQENYNWVSDHLKTPSTEEFFKAAKIGFAHFKGLVEGYNAVEQSNKLTELELYLYMSHSLIYDLARTWNITIKTVNPPLHRRATGMISHPGSYKDLFIGHNAWRPYGESTRVAKRYRLRYREFNESQIDRRTFSSYPLMLVSDDDFEIYDNAMVHMSSYIGIPEDIIDKTIPSIQGFPNWLRSYSAAQVSPTGPKWADNYKQTGLILTGVEHVIVDFKEFKYGKGFDANFIDVIDETPMGTRVKDATPHILEKGFFGTFDVPYDDEVYNMAGYDVLAKDNPEMYSYTENARYKFMDRKQDSISSIDRMKTIIYFNNPKTAGEQQNSYEYAMAGRLDLKSTDAECSGAIDSKATSLIRVLHNYWEGVSSPTHDDQSPVKLDGDVCKAEAHEGVPNELNFNWIEHYFDLDL